MADIKIAYGAATAFTMTLNSLASAAARQSTAVDNSSNKYLDALVEVTIAFPNSAPGSLSTLYVYAYASLDGTNYAEGATGTDGAYTFAATTALRSIGAIPAIQNTTSGVRYGPFAVAPAFGGILPAKWGIIVNNNGGQNLSASNNAAQYREIYSTVT